MLDQLESLSDRMNALRFKKGKTDADRVKIRLLEKQYKKIESDLTKEIK